MKLGFGLWMSGRRKILLQIRGHRFPGHVAEWPCGCEGLEGGGCEVQGNPWFLCGCCFRGDVRPIKKKACFSCLGNLPTPFSSILLQIFYEF